LRPKRFSAASQFKRLIQHRHFDVGIAKMRRELGHAVLLAVDEKNAVRAGLFLPSQQFGLIGVGGEAVDGVNARIDRDLVAENSYLPGTIDDATRESAGGSKTGRRLRSRAGTSDSRPTFINRMADRYRRSRCRRPS
jgi:hypothetical protein